MNSASTRQKISVILCLSTIATEVAISDPIVPLVLGERVPHGFYFALQAPVGIPRGIIMLLKNSNFEIEFPRTLSKFDCWPDRRSMTRHDVVLTGHSSRVSIPTAANQWQTVAVVLLQTSKTKHQAFSIATRLDTKDCSVKPSRDCVMGKHDPDGPKSATKKKTGPKTGHSRSYPRGVGLDFRKLPGLTLVSYIDHHGEYNITFSSRNFSARVHLILRSFISGAPRPNLKGQSRFLVGIPNLRLEINDDSWQFGSLSVNGCLFRS